MLTAQQIVSHPQIQIGALVAFVLAVCHTFLCSKINHLAHQQSPTTLTHHFLHFLGEIEVVFGFWALVFLIGLSLFFEVGSAISYIETINFNEPFFVFSIMCIASTRPLLHLAERFITFLSLVLAKALRIKKNLVHYFVLLSVTPLLGSFITEPAAMTLAALQVLQYLDNKTVSLRFKYVTLGLLFVNVSIGGVLTNFAAPPVVMVASVWNWSSAFMFQNFGMRSILCVFIGTLLTTLVFRKDIMTCEQRSKPCNKVTETTGAPVWLILLHLAFLFLLVVYHQHLSFIVVVFAAFLGLFKITSIHQSPLRMRESFMVGLFLAGLVTLGGMQSWWLQQLLTSVNEILLFIGATALTAVTDNAALTYLGSLVAGLSWQTKYMLVAGAVVGGGLTVIANAPNPAGYTILKDCFGEDGVQPLYLFLGALPFTLFAMLIFGCL